MTRWLTPLLLFLAILAGLALLLQRSATRGSFADAGSTYRAAEDGSRALFLLARAAGLPVSRRHLDLELIDHEGAIVLIGVNGGVRCVSADAPDDPDDTKADDTDDTKADDPDDATPQGEVSVGPTPGLGLFGAQLSSEECAALLTWVEAGGNLVHVTDEGDALLTKLGVTLHSGPDPAAADTEAPDTEDGTVAAPVDEGEGEKLPPWERWLEDEPEQESDAPKKKPTTLAILPRKRLAEGPVHRFVPGQPSVLTRGIEAVEATGEARLTTERGDAVSILVEEAAAAPGRTRPIAALAIPHGKGWVLAISLPELALNRTLGRAKNAAFWLSTLGDLSGSGTLAFDEFHHGHAAGRTILGYALEHGLLPAILQLLLMVVLAVLAGRRLGRIERLAGATLRSTADHLATMANLYRLGGHRRHAAQTIAARALATAAPYRNRPAVEAAAGHLEALLARTERSKPGERDLAVMASAAAALYAILHEKNPVTRGRDAA